MAIDVIEQPQGSGTEVKHGTIRVASPKGTGFLNANYEIDTYVSSIPTTGTAFTNYDDRFDDPRYYTGDTSG